MAIRKHAPRPLLTGLALLLGVTACVAAMGATPASTQLRAPKEDWDAARKQVARDPKWTSWFAGQRQQLDDWISKNPEDFSTQAGWMHDYVDPSDGHPLSWTPATQRPSGGDADGKRSSAWLFYVRNYNIAMVQRAARVYTLTSQAKYKNWALDQIERYSQSVRSLPVSKQTGQSRLYKQSLDEATSVCELTDAIRLLGIQGASTNEGKSAQALLAALAQDLSVVTLHGGNIAVWQAVGRGCIAASNRDASALTAAISGPDGLLPTLSGGVSADGIWREGSLGYNGFVISAITQFSLTASLNGQAGSLKEFDALMASLIQGPTRLRFADDTFPTPGDSAPQDIKSITSDPELYRVAPIQWILGSQRGKLNWDTLVDPPESIAPSMALPVVATANFPSVRMAVLKSGSWQAFVHYGQAVESHAQQEALTYELADGVQHISKDQGTTVYGSELHRNYFSLGAANNVPLVDDTGQSHWAPGDIRSFDATKNALTVTQKNYVGTTDVTRSFGIDDQGFTEQTDFNVTDNKKHQLSVVFHTVCAVKPSGDALADKPQKRSTRGVDHWLPQSAFPPADKWEADLQCGGASYKFQVTGGEHMHVSVFGEPMINGTTASTVIVADQDDGGTKFTTAVRR